MKHRRKLGSQAGFSMVEVLVALIVVSVGLLGIAKMQAVAMASTGTAKMRSLASIEAASLASTMRADRAYWASIPGPAALVVTIQNGTVTSAQDPTLNAAPATHCTSPVTNICTSAQVAAQDLADWVKFLGGVLPTGTTATITCNAPVANTSPANCTIQLNWTENVVAMNTTTNSADAASTTAAALQAVAATQYVLAVDP